jgi:hypothetical protein
LPLDTKIKEIYIDNIYNIYIIIYKCIYVCRVLTYIGSIETLLNQIF